MRNSFRHTASLLTWLFLAKLSEVFSALFVGSVIVRNLNSFDYGIFTYWISITATFSIISSLGLDKYELNRFNQESVDHFYGIFSIRLFASIILWVCIISVGYLRGEFQYALPSSFIIFVKIFDHYRNKLLADKQSNTMYKIDFKKILIGSFLRFFVISILPRVDLLLMTYIIELIYMFIVFRKKLHQSLLSLQIELRRNILKIWPLTVSTLLLALYTKLDIFLIDYFFGKELLGNYASLVRIVDIIFIAIFSLLQLRWSYIIAIPTHKKIKTFFRLSILSITIMSIVVGLAGDLIVYVLYGSSYVFDGELFILIISRLPILSFLTLTGDMLLFNAKHKTIPIRLLISLIMIFISIIILNQLQLFNLRTLTIAYSLALFFGGTLPFLFDKNFKSILKTM